MVNFNDNNTISKPPTEIINMVVIEAWYNWRLAYETYLIYKYQRKGIFIHETKARLITLFNEMQSFLERSMPKRKDTDNPFTFEEVYHMLYSSELKEDNVKDIILLLNRRLDKIQLIKIDNKQRYDRHDMEAENKMSGLD